MSPNATLMNSKCLDLSQFYFNASEGMLLQFIWFLQIYAYFLSQS